MPSRPDRSGLTVRPATRSDVEFTTRTHTHHLPHGLFPLLGQPFMKRWHQTFLTAPQGVALVAARRDSEGERLVGFLLGAVDQKGLMDHVVRHHRLGLGTVGAWALLCRPRLALHFLRTRPPAYARRLTGRPSTPPERQDSSDIDPGAPRPVVPSEPVAVVTALAVTPDGRGAGAGEALVAEFVERARAAGTPAAHLTTLDGAEGAGPFYERLGWRRRDVHPTRDGVLVATYFLPLAQPPQPPEPPHPNRPVGPAGGPRIEEGPPCT